MIGSAERWRVNGARLVLVAGAAMLTWVLSGSFPREQTLDLELGDRDARSVRRITVTWRRAGSRESAGGFVLNYPTGAPPVIEHGVDLPNGEYVLDVELTTTGRRLEPATTETRAHRVLLQETPVRVLLTGPSP